MAKAAQIVLSPLYFLQIFTSAKSFERNPVIGSPNLNARGLHLLRVKWAHQIAKARRRNLAQFISASDHEAFERDGFVIRRDFLPAEEFASLVAQVRACRRPSQAIRQGDTTNRKFVVDGQTLKQIPALRSVIDSPVWSGLISYVGSRAAAPLVYLQTIVRSGGGADPQTFLHADTFHPAVKAWLFLSDVAENAGPFTYVPGSHRLTSERTAWERRTSIDASRSANKETCEGSFRVEASELQALGLPQPRQLAAAANTLIVADTFGFHARGPSEGNSLRVEIWALGRHHPFLPWSGLDPWTTEGRGSIATFLNGLQDFFHGRKAGRGVTLSAFDVE